MKSNAELKMEAKEMLQGRWKESILMCLVPTLIGLLIGIILVIIIVLPAVLLIMNSSPDLISSGTVDDFGGGSGGGSGGLISGLISTFFTAAIGWTFLDVFRGQKMAIAPLKDIFRGFKKPYALAIVVVYILTTIFTTLWSLLLVIPGIVKSYAYSQAFFIYYDTYQNTGELPNYLNTITASRQLMNGHKGQLFLLDLSFIGWHLLAILSFGIGYLWLNPYIHATKAAFYNNLPK